MSIHHHPEERCLSVRFGKKIYTNLDAGNLKRLKDTYEYKKFKGFSAYKYEDLPKTLKEKLENFIGI